MKGVLIKVAGPPPLFIYIFLPRTLTLPGHRHSVTVLLSGSVLSMFCELSSRLVFSGCNGEMLR